MTPNPSILPLLHAVLFTATAISGLAATPQFLSRYDYAFSGEQISVGDVNGDGFPDVVGVDNKGLSVLLGSQRGIFTVGAESATSFESTYIPVLADFNGDGKLDVAFSAQSSERPEKYGVAVALGNGDGTFNPVQFYPIAASSLSPILVADLNGDHVPDLVMIEASGLWVFLGHGDGTFQSSEIPVSWQVPSGIVAADFNGDGLTDVAVSTLTGFSVLLGNGNGTFRAPLDTTTPKEQAHIVTGDVNSDGRPDLLLVAENTHQYAYSLYLGNGDGTFEGPRYPDLPDNWEVAVGDVSGDGKPDLVSSYAYVALGNGKGQFGKPSYFPTESEPLGSSLVYLVDLRLSGHLDIVEANGVYVSVLLNEGKGTFEDGNIIDIASDAGCGATADFNLDGKPDLAVATANGVSLFLGTGSLAAPFGAGPATALTGMAACLFPGDFNNDGIPDLFVSVNNASPNLPSADLFLGKGDGTFALASTMSVGDGGYYAIGDFNHDGNLDWVSTANLLALGNGDGTFQTAVPLIAGCPPVPCSFNSVAAADLNHDGWTDVVLTLNESIYVLIC